MQWRVFITPAAERVLRKLPKQVGEFVLQEFPRLAENNPLIGEKLKGKLDWLYSYHFHVHGQPYRIAYSINKEETKLVIRYADYRGKFYEKLKRMV